MGNAEFSLEEKCEQSEISYDTLWKMDIQETYEAVLEIQARMAEGVAGLDLPLEIYIKNIKDKFIDKFNGQTTNMDQWEYNQEIKDFLNSLFD